MKYMLLILLFLMSCNKDIPSEFIKPAVNGKIALTLKKYQSTKCLTHCLTRKHDACYFDDEAGVERCVKKCPLKYIAFKCTDLYKNKNGQRNVYWIKPYEWQKYIEHLTVIGFLSQDIKQLAQNDFLCEHDFIICENHREVIEALRQFVVELDE